MKLDIKKDECCGCSACMNICPKDAIEMIPEDMSGFLYPKVDNSKCIDCNLCIKVCPFLNKSISKDIPDDIKIYAAKNKNEITRKSSSSGGVYSLLADYILEKNGVIYGAMYDENLRVIHGRAENKWDSERFKGSKYVQSDMMYIYKDVKKDLQNNKLVLFTGTPCQISGLKKYLGNLVNIENLYTQDLVCHGVPSPKIYHDNIKYLEKKYESSITKINFRGKKIPGEVQDLEITLKNGNIVNMLPKMDLYYSLFQHDIILRPSCYNCKFTSLKRESDVTLADYWGIENIYPQFEDHKGVSMIILNSEKGKKIFNSINESLDYIETNREQCTQKNLYKPTTKSKLSKLFWLNIKQKGFNNSTSIIKLIILIPRIKHAINRRIKKYLKFT